MLLANAPAQAESLLHSMEQPTRTIGVYMKDKTESMRFKQDDTLSKLKDKPLKLVDHFTYLVSSIYWNRYQPTHKRDMDCNRLVFEHMEI